MRIALLNLPYDNNYGGNLQRYALMKILQDMGHDVTHINLRFHWQLPWYKMPYVYAKRIIKKLFVDHHTAIFQERNLNERYKRLCKVTDPFYERYIKHSESIIDIRELSNLLEYDAFVVGSDQVWRKTIAAKKLQTYFLDFVPKGMRVKKIAYSVSLGSLENELSLKEIHCLGELYKRFDAVSVRELSALSLLETYGWTNPKASVTLDPTLLLNKGDYIKLINNVKTLPSKGKIFCYILDESKEKQKLIEDKEKELGMVSFHISLKSEHSACIEQWLRSFNDAEYVITDSYHGLLFSIIFNKPFFLFRNQFRGNARFDSILTLLEINDDGSQVDWGYVNQLIEDYRNKAISFMNEELC